MFEPITDAPLSAEQVVSQPNHVVGLPDGDGDDGASQDLPVLKLHEQTREKLRRIINGDGNEGLIYRSGPILVDFFNDLGFSDVYENFPARWKYTDEKLALINGTVRMAQCVCKAFCVRDYVGKISQLDSMIADFNQHLVFDKWQVVRKDDVISFRKLDRVVVDDECAPSKERRPIVLSADSLGLDVQTEEVLKQRMKEIDICVREGASLAAVILIGSVLECILLGISEYISISGNRANLTLGNLIDAATKVGALRQDGKLFGSAVREFRNYIHPEKQLKIGFYPSQETAELCLGALQLAISQLTEFMENSKAAT